MIDIVNQINAIHRAIGDRPVASGAGRSLVLRRTYEATVEDVWDACTDPDRLARWLAPVEGDLRVGGTYQLKGNAGGEIVRCEPPGLLAVTWMLGEGMATEVELRLTPEGDDRTTLELEHASPAAVVDEMVNLYGPGGTIGIGGGWDISLLGLDLYLHGVPFDPATWEDTTEVKQFATRSCHAWAVPVQRAWNVGDEAMAAAVAFAVAHFAPQEA